MEQSENINIEYPQEEQPEQKSLELKIAERIKEKQAKKEFKDTSVVTYTRKYKAAYEIITLGDLEEIEKDKVSAYKLINKDKVFPKFDIEQLKAQGRSSGYCYFLVKTREALTSRPIDSEKARAVYVLACETYREGLEKITNLSELQNYNSEFIKAIGTTIMKELYEQPKWVSFRTEDYIDEETVSGVLGKSFYNFCKLRSAAAKTKFAEAIMYNAFTQEDYNNVVEKARARYKNAIDKYERAIVLVQYANDNLELGKINSEQNLYLDYYAHSTTDTLENNKQYFIVRLQTYLQQATLNYNNPERGLSKAYTVRPERWDWQDTKKTSTEGKEKVKGYTSILEEYGIIVNAKVKPLSHIKRTNGLVVPDISVENIKKHFGFKDVVFGNYMNDKESEAHVRHFLGAMLDLCEILNIDIKAINKLGGLSILFGAMGCGYFSGAMACFYPDRKAINLTKKKGDGTIAHEWSHYLDNICSEGNTIKATNINYASELKVVFENNQNLRSAFKNWYDYLMRANGKEFTTSFIFNARQDVKYHVYGTTIEESIEAIQKRHPSYADFYNCFKNPDIHKYYSYLAKHFNKTQISVPLTVKSSNFYYTSYNIALIDKPYWIETVELFARGFESYVVEKMRAKGIENNYLCDFNHNFIDLINSELDTYLPYPQGNEIPVFVKLYDDIIETIKKEFSIGGFVWNSDKRENVYIELAQDKNKEIETTTTTDDKEDTETIEATEEPITVIENEEAEKMEIRIQLIKDMINDEVEAEKKEGLNARLELLEEMFIELKNKNL